MDKINLRTRLLYCIFAVSGTIGVIWSFTGILKTGQKLIPYMVILTVWCLIAGTVLNGLKRAGWMSLAAGTCLWGIAAVFIDPLGKGIRSVSGKLVVWVNFYYETDFAFGKNISDTVTKTDRTGVLFIAFLTAFWLLYILQCAKRRWAGYLILAVGFLTPFLVGQSGSMTAALGCLIYFLALLLPNGEARRQMSAKAALLTGLAVCIAFLGAGRLTGELIGQTEDLADQIYGVLHSETFTIQRQGADAVSGSDSGILSGAGNLKLSNTIDLVLRSDTMPEQTMYLRGYVGTYYQKDKWAERSEITYLHDLNEVYERPFEKTSAGTDPLQLEVERRQSGMKYQYIPYFYEPDENNDLVADGYIRGNDEERYSVSYTPYPGLDRLWDYDAQYAVGSYGDYVYSVYLEVPEDVRTSLWEIAGEIRGNSKRETVENLQNYLLEHTAYSLNPGKTPPGEDFATYFLKENKKGYCIYYATASTLLLRILDIPARYVSGYYVPADEWKSQEDGTAEAIVKGRNAHAWTEVYLNDFGWVPVETTVPYMNQETQPVNSEPEAQVTEPEVQPELPQEQQKETPVPPETEQNQGTKEEKAPASISPQVLKICKILAGCIFLAVILMIFWFLRRILIRRSLQNGSINAQICKRFRRLVLLLNAAGMPEGTDCDQESFHRCLKEQFQVTVEGDLDRMVEIVYQAAFGNKDCSIQELADTKEKMRCISRQILDKQKAWKKWILKAWYF